jgi:hypothetical protein
MNTSQSYVHVGQILTEIVDIQEWEKLPEEDRELANGWSEPRKIRAAVGETPVSLFILAHECGHVFHGHPSTEFDWGKASNKWEWEATQWALCMLRQCGAPITKEIKDFAKGCLLGYVQDAEKYGHTIKPRIKRFIRGVKAVR